MFDYRKRGVPRTDEERAARHARMYPGEPTPQRGEGLRRRYGSIPPGRRLGVPRTEEERTVRHRQRFGTGTPPVRGTGVRRIPSLGSPSTRNVGNPFEGIPLRELVFGRRKNLPLY